MTYEELVAKVQEAVYRHEAEAAVRAVVEACADEIADCSCHGGDYCLCSCRRRIIALGGTP